MTDYNNRTPDWVKNAVFYQIFPDRFAWSSRVNKPGLFEKWDSTPTIHGYKGGDLMGVYEKLDYLEDLGINAIYFNPIFLCLLSLRSRLKRGTIRHFIFLVSQ